MTKDLNKQSNLKYANHPEPMPVVCVSVLLSRRWAHNNFGVHNTVFHKLKSSDITDETLFFL